MPDFVASDGVRIQYETVGRGPPLVFVHGWTMSGRFFARQAEGLSDAYEVVTFDLRGCGRSETRPGTHHLDRFASDLADLLEHRGLREAVVVGWSLGGGIAMRYLDRHRDHGLRGVCLIDFPPAYREAPDVADKVCHNLNKRRETFMRDFVRRMFLKDPAPGDVAWMLEENAKCATPTACEMYRQLGVSAVASPTPRPGLSALLVFPEHGWFPAALPEWKAIFPDHRAPPFPESRHCPFLEEPERFNAALSEFAAR